jgi:hypothetical protein
MPRRGGKFSSVADDFREEIKPSSFKAYFDTAKIDQRP